MFKNEVSRSRFRALYMKTLKICQRNVPLGVIFFSFRFYQKTPKIQVFGKAALICNHKMSFPYFFVDDRILLARSFDDLS